jgi:microtubule-associated protein-like 6
MKPWAGNVKEPTSYYKDPINQSKPPMIDLQLEFAHGYRSNDCRNNILYLKNGFLVYHTASLGIVMDHTNNV